MEKALKKRGAGLAAGSPNPIPRFSMAAKSTSPVWAAWQRHALWMLASYSRTGDFRHLEAFVRHFHAMRQRSLR